MVNHGVSVYQRVRDTTRSKNIPFRRLDPLKFIKIGFTPKTRRFCNQMNTYH